MYTIYNGSKVVGKADDKCNAWRIVEREFDSIDTELDETTLIYIYDEILKSIVVTLTVNRF